MCVTRVCVCVSECPEGWYGPNCALECACQHNSTCDKVTGTCLCGPGYYGHLCEHGEKWESITHTHTLRTLRHVVNHLPSRFSHHSVCVCVLQLVQWVCTELDASSTVSVLTEVGVIPVTDAAPVLPDIGVHSVRKVTHLHAYLLLTYDSRQPESRMLSGFPVTVHITLISSSNPPVFGRQSIWDSHNDCFGLGTQTVSV